MRLKGKAAIVVGAGQSPGEGVGIGRATALLFAREGANLLLVDRDRSSADETRSMIEAAGGKAHVHEADVTKESDCRSIADAARAALGRADVLFNSIGIHGPGSATDVTEEVWDRVLDTNLKGMWLTAKHILPMMIEQLSGSIVLISSIGAVRAGSALPYGISKAGVNHLTLSLAAGYARYDIRANAIMPGLVETPMAIEGAPAGQGMARHEFVAARAEKVPLPYKGSAWDIAHAALFFASDESRLVSGVCLPVDGAILAAR